MTTDMQEGVDTGADARMSLLLLGATGLVGGECLKLLAQDPAFGKIVVPARRSIQAVEGPQIEYHGIDFDEPASYRELLNTDVVICALGTTMKKAGSKAAFRRVDFEYPLTFARMAREQGARHFVLVSSAGADPKSRIFYLRVKGELEAALAALGYPALTIFRPSLLLGERAEFRRGEGVGQRILGPLGFLLPKGARPIQARRVAEAMVHAARSRNASGVRIITNAAML